MKMKKLPKLVGTELEVGGPPLPEAPLVTR